MALSGGLFQRVPSYLLATRRIFLVVSQLVDKRTNDNIRIFDRQMNRSSASNHLFFRYYNHQACFALPQPYLGISVL